VRNDVLEINYNSNGLFQISIRSKLLALLFHPQFTLDLSVICGTPHLVHLYKFFRPMGGSNNKELEIDCLRFPSLYLKAIIIVRETDFNLFKNRWIIQGSSRVFDDPLCQRVGGS